MQRLFSLLPMRATLCTCALLWTMTRTLTCNVAAVFFAPHTNDVVHGVDITRSAVDSVLARLITPPAYDASGLPSLCVDSAYSVPPPVLSLQAPACHTHHSFMDINEEPDVDQAEEHFGFRPKTHLKTAADHLITSFGAIPASPPSADGDASVSASSAAQKDDTYISEIPLNLRPTISCAEWSAMIFALRQRFLSKVTVSPSGLQAG